MRALALFFVAAVAACGGGSSTSSPGGAGGSGGFVTGAGGGTAGGAGGLGGAGGAGGFGGSGGAGLGGDAGGGAGGGGVKPPIVCAGKSGDAGTHFLSFPSAGGTRSAWLHVPPGYDPTKGATLVANFHGFGSDGPQEALLSGMSALADERGVLVVYPYGVASSWNAGACCGTAWLDAVDDVAFVGDLLDRVEADWCVDPSRVFATGMSNGGFLSHRLGCELSDRVAAIAPVAGVLGVPDCSPARPVPVLHVHGTEDPLVPWGGGTPLLPWDVGPVQFISVGDSIAAWRAIDGCGPASQPTYAKGDASCQAWSCAAGSTVELCTIDGGGHTWPGGLPIPSLGKTSTDLDASAYILDFFDAHPMP